MPHAKAPRELVACCLTSRIGAAVSMIGIAGSNAENVVVRLFRAAKQHRRPASETTESSLAWQIGLARFGHWDIGKSLNEEVVVCKVGDNHFEVQCHGGIVVDRVLSGLQRLGCRVVSSQQWLEVHSMPWLERQTHLQLQNAPTRRVAAILLRHLQGGLRSWIELAADRIENGKLVEATRLIRGIQQFEKLACHLLEPWKVALAGPPNVGKSSLLNRILGFDRAIVHDEPGTTRDRVSGETAIGGWPIRFTDTAGLRETQSRIESEGIALATELLTKADLVLIVVEANVGWTDTHAQIAEQVADRGFVVVNKSDLNRSEQATLFCNRYSPVWVSAITGDGVHELLRAIELRLIPEPPGVKDVLPVITDLRDLLNRFDIGDAEQAAHMATTLRSFLSR